MLNATGLIIQPRYTGDRMRFGKEVLRSIPKTVHGGQAWKLEGVEDYSHNLNPFGPPEELPEIILSAMDDIGHYPDDGSTELKNVISKEFSVNEENVLIGSGSSELIRNFPNAFLERNDKVTINDPSFAEYTQQCRIIGADIQYNHLLEEDDFKIDPERISDHIAQGTKAVYICNPNNPTGRVEGRDKILEIVKECSDNNVLVFLDETLLELVSEYRDVSCARYVKKYDNLMVIGSLTKSFAIPGIRIGYGFAGENIADEMNKIRMTWNVGQIEQNVASTLISKHMDHVIKAADMMKRESKVMHSALDNIGFPIGELSDSFIYFCSLRELGVKCSEFQKLMLKEKIMIRDCSSFGTRFEEFVRFSVKDRERNDRFVEAVERSMKEMR